MKHDPQHFAEALYLATRDMSDADTEEAVTRFIGFIDARGLTAILPAVLDALPGAADRSEGIQKVSIQSARELPEQTIGDVLDALKIDPKAVRVETEILPELLGGIRIKKEDNVYDTTIKKRLTRLKAHINGKQA